MYNHCNLIITLQPYSSKNRIHVVQGSDLVCTCIVKDVCYNKKSLHVVLSLPVQGPM